MQGDQELVEVLGEQEYLVLLIAPDDLYIIYYRETRRLPMERGEAAIGIQKDCQWDAATLQLRHGKIANGTQRGCN